MYAGKNERRAQTRGVTLIRLAEEADIPGIQAVARVAWEHTYKDIMRPQTRSHFLDEFYNYDALAKALDVRPGGIWVAVEDRSIIGFIQIVPMLDGSGLELTRLYVLPSCQRRGVGHALFSCVVDAYPASTWWALVERDDHKAVSFYLKQSFVKRRNLTLNIFGEDLAFVEFYRNAQ